MALFSLAKRMVQQLSTKSLLAPEHTLLWKCNASGLTRTPMRCCSAAGVGRTLTMESVTMESVEEIDKGINVKFHNTKQHKFNNIWLRDHCRCPKCYLHETNQREVDTHTIPLNIAPADIQNKGNTLQIIWPDNHVSTYDADWLYKNHYGQPYNAFTISPKIRQYWGKEKINDMIPSVDYERVISDDEGLHELLTNIAVYGLGFVSNTPTNRKGMENVGRAIGPLKQSQYGDSWEITNTTVDKIEHMDSSYLNVGLPAHSDGTYSIDAPGLQFFHITMHDGIGGDSLYVDAIKCAEDLRARDPQAFEFLSTRSIPGFYWEPKYWARDYGPVIKVNPVSKEIYQIRLNNLDRDVLSCLGYDDVQRFYESLHSFEAILKDEANELWYRLQPGTLAITDNWRVFHGRSEFTGNRCLQGLYINRDDYLSRLRLLDQQFAN